MTLRKDRQPPGTASLLLFLLLASPAGAQVTAPGAGPVIRGAVTAEESGLALATGSVSLYRTDGTELLTVLTDDRGRYLLQAPAPGAYRLRAERLGYRPRERGPFTLGAADTLTVDFQLPPAPIPMDSILVSVRRRAQPIRAGEQFVYGRLLDDDGGAPIPQGLVRLLTEWGASATTTLTDDEGLFWLVSPSAGTYRLQAERLGYRSSTGPEIYLMLGDTIGVDFYLSVDAVLLEPLVVRATARSLGDRYDLTGMAGFLNRYSRHSKSGFGEFLTRDSIAEYEGKVISTGHLLMEKTMSVRQVMAGSIDSRDSADRFGQVILRGGCRPNYYIDGFLVPPDAVNKGNINPMALYPPQNLEAVEIYVHPMIPAEFFQGGFPCGVVSLWTRKEPATADSSIPSWKKWLTGLGILSMALFLSR